MLMLASKLLQAHSVQYLTGKVYGSYKSASSIDHFLTTLAYASSQNFTVFIYQQCYAKT